MNKIIYISLLLGLFLIVGAYFSLNETASATTAEALNVCCVEQYDVDDSNPQDVICDSGGSEACDVCCPNPGEDDPEEN